jgi:multisubunit Na+/H+ antiporter MnhF subunit
MEINMSNIKYFYKTLSYIVIIGIIFICGCAATAAYTKFYEGP